MCLCSLPAKGEDTPQTITIALINSFPTEFYEHVFTPTIDYLKKNMPEYRFKVVEIGFKGIVESIDKTKPDFIVASASDFLELADSHGAVQLSSLIRKDSPNPLEAMASTFIVRPQSAIDNLWDAKGRTVVINDERSFDGWLIAQGELIALGLRPNHFFSQVIQAGNQDKDIASMVRTGKADIGVLRTCAYENLLKSGDIREGEFRIVNQKPDDGFCVRSTERYPNLIFAAMPAATPEMIRRLTIVLLTKPRLNSRYYWSFVNNFQTTNALLKKLSLAPYTKEQKWTFIDLWNDYRNQFYIGLIIFFGVLFHSLRVNVLVVKRTAQLKKALSDMEAFYKQAQESRQKLLTFERMSIVSHLSSMFAHEVKQPLANIRYYVGALHLLLKKENHLSPESESLLEEMNNEVIRSAEIVDHVRIYAKKRQSEKVPYDLGVLVTKAVSSEKANFINVELHGSYPIFADPFEILFILSNLLKNALAVVKDQDDPEIDVYIESAGQDWKVFIDDNGPRISEEVFQNLGNIGQSSKENGLGFGLLIASDLAEANGGHLAFMRKEPNGLSVVLQIAKYEVEITPSER